MNRYIKISLAVVVGLLFQVACCGMVYETPTKAKRRAQQQNNLLEYADARIESACKEPDSGKKKRKFKEVNDLLTIMSHQTQQDLGDQNFDPLLKTPDQNEGAVDKYVRVEALVDTLLHTLSEKYRLHPEDLGPASQYYENNSVSTHVQTPVRQDSRPKNFDSPHKKSPARLQFPEVIQQSSGVQFNSASGPVAPVPQGPALDWAELGF